MSTNSIPELKPCARYSAEARREDAIVYDNQRDEIFCVVPQSILWTGHDGALARATDIAEAFNRVTRPPASAAPGDAERGARQLYKDYEETNDEHVELVFSPNACPQHQDLADEMRQWFRAAFEASGAADQLAIYARRVVELEGALELMPDEIEVFRIMQATGGKRADMAKAVGRRIEEIRAALTGEQG